MNQPLFLHKRRLSRRIDYPYIETWIRRCGLVAIWQEILAAIRPGYVMA